MQYAYNCYDIRNTNVNNPWMKKSNQQQGFESLTATFKEIRENISKLGNDLKAKTVTRATKQNSDKWKVIKNKGRTNTGAWPWKDVETKDVESK